MDSIVFYQPPSPKWPSRSALDKSVLEPIDNEDDGWELPSLSEVLAEAKQKRAGVPVHQDCLSLVQERTNDGGRPVISQTSTRAATEDHIGAHVCSSRSGSTQQKNLSIEPHIDAKLSQSTRCQHNLAISAPKALDLISQNEGACRPVPLDVVDDQATYEEIVTGAQNDKQHCFGDQRSFGRVETSTRLDRSCDRIHGRVHDGQDVGAAAGNIYDIFAEYEKIFCYFSKAWMYLKRRPKASEVSGKRCDT
ncbi:hypothetical protein B0J12DRAFT_164249 [Macrophomina phaseolina]|uniref:Uncharacterized protein n=1 Tax=Macrophomina phaseolina TaxID=35725 RepID=A0ABQ8GRZ5_9PEZI|nr:hypothetical protein B0J12DRAFT_164249 [Macrophomina phaseolina]